MALIPTSPFPILEPRNPCIDKFYVVQERHTMDFEALKLENGSSGRKKEKKAIPRAILKLFS